MIRKDGNEIFLYKSSIPFSFSFGYLLELSNKYEEFFLIDFFEIWRVKNSENANFSPIFLLKNTIW